MNSFHGIASWLVGEAELTKLKDRFGAYLSPLPVAGPSEAVVGPSEAVVRLLPPLLIRDFDELGGRNNLMKW